MVTTRHLSLGAVVTVACAVWGLAVGLEALGDNSFLTHLAAGRLVLAEGIPRFDPWSFTAVGAPWVVQSWLAAGLYAAADGLADGYGMLALNALVMTGLGLLVARLCTGATSVLPRLAVGGLALGVGAATWAERPLAFGLLFLGLVLLCADGDVDPRWLVPAFAVWVNVHGSFPLGLLALACLLVGARLDGEDAGPEKRALVLGLVGTVLGTFGPLGPRLVLFPFELLSRGAVLSRVVEWQAPAFTSLGQRLWLAQLLLAVVLVVRRPRWRTTVPLVAFGAASLLALRNIPVASLVLLPAMAGATAGLGSLPTARRSAAATGMVAVLAGVGAVLVVQASASPAYDLGDYPGRQVALLRAGLPAPGRVASHDLVGNWLEVTEGDGVEVFFDDRFDMYPASVSADYAVLLDGGPGWESVLDRHRIDTVLWQRDEPLAELVAASPAWQVTAGDRLWVTARRR